MKAGRPCNIIYIVCHDLGRHLGCYGAPVESPALDRFARGAAMFTQAFCNSAVCSPSRGCAMTGLPAHNNGIVGLSHFGWRFLPGVQTIVDYLNAAGYDTIHCGVSHEGEEGNHRYGLEFEVSWRSRHVENAVDDAIAVLKSRQGSRQPFYLNVGFQEVHRSIYNPDTDSRGFPARLHLLYGGPVPDAQVYLPPHIPDRPAYRKFMAKFQACIRYMDQQVGRLFRAIEETGHGENTLVIFTTDHGIYGMRAKSSLYDAGMAITLLAQPPAPLRRQAVHDCLVQNIDVVPTLLDAAGVPVRSNLPGKSFWPLLTGQPYEPHREIFTEWNFGGPIEDYQPARAIRTDRHHLILNLGDAPKHRWLPGEVTDDMPESTNPFVAPWPDPVLPETRAELYDVVSDPNEFTNLAGRKEMADTYRQLEDKIRNWMKRTDDFLLTGRKPSIPSPPGFGIPDGT